MIQKGIRGVIDTFKKHGELVKIKEELDPKYEISAVKEGRANGKLS